MATLEQLRQKKKESGLVQNPDSLKTLSTNDLRKIMPAKEEENTPKKLVENELNDLDKDLFGRIETDNKQTETITLEVEDITEDKLFDLPVDDIDAGIVPAEEADKMLAEVFNSAAASIKEDPSIKAGVEAVSNVGNTTAPENMEMEDLLKELDDDDDFDDEESEEVIREEDDSDDDELSDEEEQEKQKKMIKDMQDQISVAIKPFNNVIDLKSFKISTKPKSAKKVLEQVSEGPTATWVLMGSEVPFTCTALGAVEIENLDPNKINAQNGRIDALKQMYGTLYRHYVSPNKPKSLEAWLKTIAYVDQDNLIFGYYKATFGQSNLMNYACEKCSDVKIKNVPIEDCIKYKNDETKKKVEDILRYGDPTHVGEIKSTLIQVSDTLAVSIKNPSIYNIVFEFGVLDSGFTNKYADVLGTVGYIEDIYEIDVYNGTLIPIEIKEDANNLTKSVKRRIRAKLEILKTLTPDQYQILLGEVAKISMNSENISYCQPAYTCEKCGTEIEEVEMTAQQMLFIRHQLALIKTLSIE